MTGNLGLGAWLFCVCVPAFAQNAEQTMPNGCVVTLPKGAIVHRAEGRCAPDGRGEGDWQIWTTVNNQARWFHTFYWNGLQHGFSMVLHAQGGEMEVRNAKDKVVWRSTVPKVLSANSPKNIEALLDKANFEAAVAEMPTRVTVEEAKQAVLQWLADRAAFLAAPALAPVEPQSVIAPALADDPKARGRSAKVM